MGILNIPFPLFEQADRLMSEAVAPVIRLALWALVAALLSMGLYWLFSAKHRIARISAQAAAARRDLARYDGDFAGVWPLTTRVLSISLKHLRLTAGPAVVASLPLIFLLAWLGTAYGHRFAQPGEIVEVAAFPDDAELRWTSESQIVMQNGLWRLAWPAPDRKIRLFDAAGRAIAEFPHAAPVAVIHKKRWWNLILGNPAGYIPDDSLVDRIEINLPQTQYLDVGPEWLRSWEATFLTVLVVASVAIKVVFRIK